MSAPVMIYFSSHWVAVLKLVIKGERVLNGC